MNMSNNTNNYNMRTPFEKATYFLLLVPPPILIGLGTAGNLIAFYLLNKNARLRKESVVVYLRLYFIISTLVLIIGSGQDWLCHATGLPFLWNSADYVCRLWEFSSSLLFYFPPWILSAILVDRCLLAVKSPWVSYVCDVFSAKVISAVIFVGLTAITVHVLWTFELHPVFGCAIPPDRHDFHSIVWPWVSVVAYSFFPIGVLTFCSIYLLFIELGCIINIPRSHEHDHDKGTVEMVYVSPEVESELSERENEDQGSTEFPTHKIEITEHVKEDRINDHQKVFYTSLKKTESEETLPSQNNCISDIYPIAFSGEKQRQSLAVPNTEKALAGRTHSDKQTETQGFLGVKRHVARRTLSDGQVVQLGRLPKSGTRRTTSDGHIGISSHSFGHKSDHRTPILTTTSLCMGLLCVMATLPATVLNVFVMQVPVNSLPDGDKMEKLNFVFALFQMIVVFSKSMMPFLVFLTSPMLREDVRHSFRATFSKERSDSVVLTTALNGTLQLSSTVCPGIKNSRC